MKVSKYIAEQRLRSLTNECFSQEKSLIESWIKRFDGDLLEIALPSKVAWPVRLFMGGVLRQLESAAQKIAKYRSAYYGQLQRLARLSCAEITDRYGQKAQEEFKRKFPEESAFLAQAYEERDLLDRAAKWASTRYGISISRFQEQQLEVIVASDTFEYEGTAFRRVFKDTSVASDARHFIVYAHDIPDAPALGTLRLSSVDEVHVRFQRSELRFTHPTGLPPRTIDDPLQVAFGQRFRHVIVEAIKAQTYDENHITFSLIEALRSDRPYRMVTPAGVALIRLRVHKQKPPRESDTGDLCIIVERAASDVSGVGVCFLEAKRRYLYPETFKALSADQLARIREHSAYCSLLLYDYIQPEEWICSTVRICDALATDGRLKDVGIALAEKGMPFCDRLVTRYFRLQEMDLNKASVTAAARDARHHFEQTLHAQIALGNNDQEALERLRTISMDLDHLIEFGMTRKESLEIENQQQARTIGGPRGPGSGFSLG